jgi:sortase A
MKNKLLLLLIFFGIVVGTSIGVFFTHSHNQLKKEVKAIEAANHQQESVSVPNADPGIPTDISIPKIHVQASVESVGMDSQGRMDVPKTAVDTAWYSPGYKPGMKGSAVIDGHLDRVTGAPAVFWNLKELSAGDLIIVNENNGMSYTFAVSRIVRYPYNSFPLQEVFGAADVPMLNLITCNGVWDKNTKNYSDRLVVYSKLVAEK